MCAIAGIRRLDGGPVERRVLEAMLFALRHRGPDGSATFLNGSVGLAHSLLAITGDATNSLQPVSYNGRHWIAYNGEVYNHAELKRELQGLGVQFQTDLDTEVVLAAFAVWGRDCQSRFNGMWAFVIYDSLSEELFLSRDRFGVKPLYWAQRGSSVYFASEMKAILAADVRFAELDEAVFAAEILDPIAAESREQRHFKGISQLAPGHCATVSARGVEVSKWWSLRQQLELAQPEADLRVTSRQFRELFEESCLLRSRQGKSVALSLSGGLDSASIAVALYGLSDARRGLPRGTGIAFVGHVPGTDVDELPYAKAVAETTCQKLNVYRADPLLAVDTFDATIRHVENITLGPLFMMWELYRQQRLKGFCVSLDGHGGDELLGGYPYYLASTLQDAVSKVSPARLVAGARTLRGLERSPKNAGPRIKWFRDLVAATCSARTGSFAADGRNGNFSSAQAPASASRFLRHRIHDIECGMLPFVLRNFDRMSMAHGVEVRTPFLDWRLVVASLSLPESHLVRGGFTKFILRHAFEAELPRSVYSRTDKVGFAAPISEWIVGPWRAWIGDMLRSRRFLESPFWNARAVSDDFDRRCNAGSWTWQEWSAMWRLLQASTLLGQVEQVSSAPETLQLNHSVPMTSAISF